MDTNWLIENLELAMEYFKEKQNEHTDWENSLNTLRKNKKELDDLYWQIKGLIKQFNQHYNEAVSTRNDIETLENEHKKGGVSEEGSLHRGSQLRNKLTNSFQCLIDYHEKIKNKIPVDPLPVNCRNCGRQNKSGLKFCTRCGAKLFGT